MGTTENNRGKASKKNVEALQESMSSIKHKFLVMSSQGGVGKTFVILNLALALSKRGVKVGLLDVNFHGPDIHRMFGLELALASYSDQHSIPVAYSDNLKVASIESVIQERNKTGIWGNPLKISDIRRFISRVNWGSLDYLFVDTPIGPSEELLTVIRAIPEAKTIIVTAPHKISSDRAKKMINFFEKEKIPIFGWIENMQGFLCQRCGEPHEMFSTGPGSRAIFLADIPFLGKIPIDPHLRESADTAEVSLRNYADSEIAGGCKLIIEKIMAGDRVI